MSCRHQHGQEYRGADSFCQGVEKKEECNVMVELVKIILVEVDKLSKVVGEEEKVEKDLEMLRADFSVLKRT